MDNFHPVSPPVPFDAAWKLDDDDEMMPFSLSFSRDEEDGLLATLAQDEDVGSEFGPLSPFHIELYSGQQEDSTVSPDLVASTEDESSSTAENQNNTSTRSSPSSRKRKIVTPQQRKRQLAASLEMEASFSSSSSTGNNDNKKTASLRMLSCMERSEATRAEILAHFPSEDSPIAKKRQSIQHCFFHTQTTREQLLSWLG